MATTASAPSKDGGSIKATLYYNNQPIQVSIEEITPPKAHEYLSHSNGKQTKGRSGMSRYVEDMLEGRWLFTGESIIFNRNGNLDNGYSRLDACIKSGKPFISLVVRGIESKSFDVLDTGKSRTLADLLAFKGKEYVNTVGYCLKRLAAMDKGDALRSDAKVTRQEEIDALKKYPEIEGYARRTQALGKNIPHSLLCLVWFLFGREYPKETAEFFRAFSPRAGDAVPSKYHPAQLLREIFRQGENPVKPEQHMYKAARLKYACAALNAHILGVKLRYLNFDKAASTVGIGNSGKSFRIS